MAALDFEDRSSYSVRVTATYPSGETDFVDVTVGVVNVDEEGAAALDVSAPVLGTLLSASLSDPDNVDVASVSWVWQRSQDKSTWTPIADAVLAAYTVVRDDQGSWLKAVATYTDGHGSDKTAEAETGSEVPPNRAPQFVEAAPVNRVVFEDAAVGSPIGLAITANDDDPGDAALLVYSLGGTDETLFDIDSGSGQLRVSSALDYELVGFAGSYSVTVTATDPSGETAVIDVTVGVTDASVEIRGSAFSSVSAPVAFSVEVNDSSGETNIRWSVQGPASFSANGSGARFSFTPRAAGVYSVTITATATDGAKLTESLRLTVLGRHRTYVFRRRHRLAGRTRHHPWLRRHVVLS